MSARVFPLHTAVRPGCSSSSRSTLRAHASRVIRRDGLVSRLQLRPLLLPLWQLALRPRLRDRALSSWPTACSGGHAVTVRGPSRLTDQRCRKRRRNAPQELQPVSLSSGAAM